MLLILCILYSYKCKYPNYLYLSIKNKTKQTESQYLRTQGQKLRVHDSGNSYYSWGCVWTDILLFQTHFIQPHPLWTAHSPAPPLMNCTLSSPTPYELHILQPHPLWTALYPAPPLMNCTLSSPTPYELHFVQPHTLWTALYPAPPLMICTAVTIASETLRLDCTAHMTDPFYCLLGKI